MYKPILLLFSTTVLYGCNKDLPPIEEPESRPAKLFTVSVDNNVFERNFPASSEAGDKAVLTFRVPGQIETITVSAGQRVEKGDLLASLDADEYSLLEQQARAKYILANVQFERFKKLRADKVVSEQDFDQAKANYNSSIAQLEQAKANHGYTKLTAPYSGTISLLPAERFEFVDAKQGIMNIQTNQLIKVIFQLPNQLLNRFAGDPNIDAMMTFDSFPEHQYPLNFQEVDTEADPKTGSYKVTMVMESPQDVGILPGMAGNVHVKMDAIKATSIPQSAVMQMDGQVYVWKVKSDGTVEKVKVVLNDVRQIEQGLENGDKIVASGVGGLKSGDKVREWIKERGL